MLDCCPSRLDQFRSRPKPRRNHQMGKCRNYPRYFMAISDLFLTKRVAGTTVENGAVTSLFAATSPDALTLGGKVCHIQLSVPMVKLIRSFSIWFPTHKLQTQFLKPAMQNLPRSCGTGVRMSLRDTEWPFQLLFVCYRGAWVLGNEGVPRAIHR